MGALPEPIARPAISRIWALWRKSRWLMSVLSAVDILREGDFPGGIPMNNSRNLHWLAALCIALVASQPDTARAQADVQDKWYFTPEISTVAARGNSESVTYGLSSTLGFRLPRSEVKIELGGLLTQATLQDWSVHQRSSLPDTLIKNEITERTAEAFYARGRYDFKFAKYFLVFVGGDWMRNTFAGIDSRFLTAVGFGNTWVDSKKTRFTTDYSGTYTIQQDVIDNPLIKGEFPGVRLSYDFWQQFTSSTEFESELRFDINIEDSDDLRLNWYNALPISISSKVAFKPSVVVAWRNQPSLTSVPLFDPVGNQVGFRPVQLEKLDTFTSLTLLVRI